MVFGDAEPAADPIAEADAQPKADPEPVADADADAEPQMMNSANYQSKCINVEIRSHY